MDWAVEQLLRRDLQKEEEMMVTETVVETELGKGSPFVALAL